MACHRFSNGFAYMCQECDDYFDIRCCLIPKIIKIEGHQHSLFHAISSKEDCNACGSDACVHGLFVCKECDFALGFECATLLLKAKYEHDPHLLSLTYTAENASTKHYCLICEEERDPDKLLYYCAECNLATHTECVIGRHPTLSMKEILLKKITHILSILSGKLRILDHVMTAMKLLMDILP
jgi:hypothetical protein